MARNTYKEDERLEEAFNIKHLFRAFKYIKKYRRQMLVALFISALGGMFGYLSPMIVRRALDVAVPDQNTAMLYRLAGMLAGVYIFSIAFSTIRSRLMINASQNIIYDIRKDLFAHLQELPFAYYDNRPHGKILIRVVNYVNSVSDMLSNGLINVVLEGFNLIVIIMPEIKVVYLEVSDSNGIVCRRRYIIIRSRTSGLFLLRIHGDDYHQDKQKHETHCSNRIHHITVAVFIIIIKFIIIKIVIKFHGFIITHIDDTMINV